jgi:hypothetical protein
MLGHERIEDLKPKVAGQENNSIIGIGKLF